MGDESMLISVPRTHGDEPGHTPRLRSFGRVFPVPTGMNRLKPLADRVDAGVPRTHGDEPLSVNYIPEIRKCSPYPRG